VHPFLLISLETSLHHQLLLTKHPSLELQTRKPTQLQLSVDSSEPNPRRQLPLRLALRKWQPTLHLSQQQQQRQQLIPPHPRLRLVHHKRQPSQPRLLGHRYLLPSKQQYLPLEPHKKQAMLLQQLKEALTLGQLLDPHSSQLQSLQLLHLAQQWRRLLRVHSALLHQWLHLLLGRCLLRLAGSDNLHLLQHQLLDLPPHLPLLHR
jgi:hypothetical protein